MSFCLRSTQYTLLSTMRIAVRAVRATQYAPRNLKISLELFPGFGADFAVGFEASGLLEDFHGAASRWPITTINFASVKACIFKGELNGLVVRESGN